jgi:hypothetical protein
MADERWNHKMMPDDLQLGQHGGAQDGGSSLSSRPRDPANAATACGDRSLRRLDSLSQSGLDGPACESSGRASSTILSAAPTR